jgi:hypothetical protein
VRAGTTSVGRRLAQHVARADRAGLGALIDGPFSAGLGAELGQELASGLTAKDPSKNELERALRQLFTSGEGA